MREMKKRRSRNPPLIAFGLWLQELRGKNTRQQISQRLRTKGAPLGGSTLAQYEKGSVWAPDANVLLALGEIYNVSVDTLIMALRVNRRNTALVEARELRDLVRHAQLESSSPAQSHAQGGGPTHHEIGGGGATQARVQQLEDELRRRNEFIAQIEDAAIKMVRLFATAEDRGSGTHQSRRRGPRRKAG